MNLEFEIADSSTYDDGSEQQVALICFLIDLGANKSGETFFGVVHDKVIKF